MHNQCQTLEFRYLFLGTSLYLSFLLVITNHGYRIYNGVIRKGNFIINVNTGKKIKVRDHPFLFN